ncbi:MAG: hypothetical protein IH616_09695, partial [Gemmatimonadales bacterium]|nr:hypothetical protein [Gemmatimonadales bacterium]
MQGPSLFRGLLMVMRTATLILVGCGLVGCGERSEAQSYDKVQKMAAELAPAVERAVGLPFKTAPTVAVRTRAQVRGYLAAKLDAELPPRLLDGMGTAYRLFGMLPDSVDLRSLLLALYTEQVIGYYDPDSTTLYVVQGTDAASQRMILAHELVHALQGQYMRVDTLIAPSRVNDARTAAQAVLEGQATLASLTILMPGRDFDAIPDFWETYRESLEQQQATMPVFNTAPLLIREGIVFPYLEGAEFVRWFVHAFPDTLPFGRYMPQSTEQILHPDRYREGDAPVPLQLAADDPAPQHTDVLGEFEIRILLTELTGSVAVAQAATLGWGGDRYAVYRTDGGDALVWWAVWDDETAAGRFAAVLKREWGVLRA